MKTLKYSAATEINLDDVELTRMPDGLPHIKCPTYTCGHVTVTASIRNETDLIKLAMVANVLELVSKTLVVKYDCSSRMDKRNSINEPLTNEVFWNIISSMYFDKVIQMCPHSNIERDWVKNSPATRFFMKKSLELFREEYSLDNNDVFICFPDKGAGERFKDYFLTDQTFICQKVREQSTGRIVSYEVPELSAACKAVFCVDDLVDGGATFKLLFSSIKEKRPDVITALSVFHGVFSKAMDFASDIDWISSTTSYRKISDPVFQQLDFVLEV